MHFTFFAILDMLLYAMHIAHVSSGKFSNITIWALIAATIFIVMFSLLGRASLNLKGAVVDNPDLAVYVLLPDEEITKIELVRELEQERDYLLTTTEGMKYLKLRKVDGKWVVAEIEKLREEL